MRVVIALLFFVFCCLYAKAQLSEQATSKNQFSIKPAPNAKHILMNFSNINKANIKPVTIFNKSAGSYKPNEKLPIFCELEYQLSRLIKRRVKFGVEPEQDQY